MTTRTILLPDMAASARLGAALAGLIRPGDAIWLTGSLGAGKTTLARAIIARLCGVEDVPSPTYTLVQSYEALAGFPVLHGDLYRVEDASELIELGLEEAIEDGAVIMEWPGLLDPRLMPDRLEITLDFEGASGQEGARSAAITAHGGWEARLERIAV
ncbi:tRNA (adenosine(37)-N6)-threonylcarbamoyltransferase complex ATPase subunit type 1 TsaE [Glycocaulis sp.]